MAVVDDDTRLDDRLADLAELLRQPVEHPDACCVVQQLEHVLRLDAEHAHHPHGEVCLASNKVKLAGLGSLQQHCLVQDDEVLGALTGGVDLQKARARAWSALAVFSIHRASTRLQACHLGAAPAYRLRLGYREGAQLRQPAGSRRGDTAGVMLTANTGYTDGPQLQLTADNAVPGTGEDPWASWASGDKHPRKESL